MVINHSKNQLKEEKQIKSLVLTPHRFKFSKQTFQHQKYPPPKESEKQKRFILVKEQ